MSLYDFAKGLFRLQFSLMRWKIRGVENVPKEGPLIVAVNHISLWDPIVAGCALPRQISFMAKEQLFSIPLLGYIIKKLGTFPVKRGQGDMGAIRQSLAILKEGRVLAIFPEGTRSKTGKIQKGLPGIVLLMEKSKAPIVPVKVNGTQHLLTKGWGKLEVIIGKPLFPEMLQAPEDVENRREWAVEQIMKSLNSLK